VGKPPKLLVKNLSGFLFGSRLTSRRPPQLEMTMIVRGLFRLSPGQPIVPLSGDPMAQGRLMGDVWADEDEERAGALLYASDLVDWKPRADVLLKGHAHAPGGTPASSVAVGFAVGDWSKRLVVLARRYNVYGPHGWQRTEGKPFLRRALDWKNAYGGPGFEANPVGCGLTETSPDQTPVMLPSVGPFTTPVRGPEELRIASCFMPVNPNWALRVGKRGKNYGEEWQKTRFPWVSDDFDWTHYNAAPDDQQIDGYLRGDETLRFVNLHPDAPNFTLRLPNPRVRCFLHDTEDRFREARMVLDTLYADLDEEVLTLTWRGLVKVRADDLSDVRSVLVVSEPGTEPARPGEEYLPIAEAFEADPVGLMEAVRNLPPQLGTPIAMLEELRKIPGIPAFPALPFGLKGDPKKLPPGFAEMFQTLGALLSPSSAGDKPDPVSAFTRPLVGPMAPKVQAQIEDGMTKAIALANKNGIDPLPELAQRVQDAKTAIAARLKRPGSLPTVSLGAVLGDAWKVAQDLIKKCVPPDMSFDMSKLKAAFEAPELKQIDPNYVPPTEEAGEAPKRNYKGVDISYRNLSNRDFSGFDFSEANMMGADLTGTRLDGCMMAGANLESAILDRASLRKAALAGANLTKATARDADFTQATLAGALAPEADFSRSTFGEVLAPDLKAAGARFDDAGIRLGVWAGADFTNASFAGTRVELALFDNALFDDADLSGAHFTTCSMAGAQLSRVQGARLRLELMSINGAKLAEADLSDAIVVQTSFREIDGRGLKLDRAQFTLTIFGQADLTGASFVQAQGERLSWEQSRLDQANFFQSILPNNAFTDVTGIGAHFAEADLRRSLFHRAALERTSFAHANLFRADFTRATLTHIRFDEANLYEGRFPKVVARGCTFEGANVTGLVTTDRP
jgi:uncharacterized protein YjbI with pentapeptide repeats